MSDERDPADDRTANSERRENESNGDAAEPESETSDPTTETPGPMSESATSRNDDPEPTDDDERDLRQVRRYVEYAVLGALILIGVIALVQFYLSASNAISTWIATEYRSLFRAAFNLAVLLLVGGAITWQLRQMGALGDDG
jgi:hypothetical protein